MGEPLANYKRVVGAIRRLTDPEPDGLGLSQRGITVSTVGLVPAMLRFADEGFKCRLAVSLHAPDDELRDTLVPVNTRWKVREVLDAAWEYAEISGRRISIEYALIRDINDQAWRADLLGRLLKGQRVHVNLIPLNPTPGLEVDGLAARGRAGVRRGAGGARRAGDRTGHPRAGDRRRVRAAGGLRALTAVRRCRTGPCDRTNEHSDRGAPATALRVRLPRWPQTLEPRSGSYRRRESVTLSVNPRPCAHCRSAGALVLASRGGTSDTRRAAAAAHSGPRLRSAVRATAERRHADVQDRHPGQPRLLRRLEVGARGVHQETGYKVKVLRGGDAGAAVNQAILTKGHPQGDVFFGVDNTLLSRALDNGLFTPYTAKGLGHGAGRGSSSTPTAPGHARSTPATSASTTTARTSPRTSWPRRRRSPTWSSREYKNLLVTENAATSSPGPGLPARHRRRRTASGGWQGYWKKLQGQRRRGRRRLGAGVQRPLLRLRGGKGKGDRPLVVSYASSPPAEVLGVEARRPPGADRGRHRHLLPADRVRRAAARREEHRGRQGADGLPAQQDVPAGHAAADVRRPGASRTRTSCRRCSPSTARRSPTRRRWRPSTIAAQP